MSGLKPTCAGLQEGRWEFCWLGPHHSLVWIFCVALALLWCHQHSLALGAAELAGTRPKLGNSPASSVLQTPVLQGCFPLIFFSYFKCSMK